MEITEEQNHLARLRTVDQGEGGETSFRPRDRIEAVKRNFSLSLFFSISAAHVADPPTVSITFEGIIIIDHPLSHFPTLSLSPFLRLLVDGPSYRLIAIVVGDLAGAKSWTLAYDRSTSIVREPISTRFVLASDRPCGDFRDFGVACTMNDSGRKEYDDGRKCWTCYFSAMKIGLIRKVAKNDPRSLRLSINDPVNFAPICDYPVHLTSITIEKQLSCKYLHLHILFSSIHILRS